VTLLGTDGRNPDRSSVLKSASVETLLGKAGMVSGEIPEQTNQAPQGVVVSHETPAFSGSASAADGALTGTSLPVRPPGREQGTACLVQREDRQERRAWSPALTRFLFLFEEAA
jgi:hypothetical protein